MKKQIPICPYCLKELWACGEDKLLLALLKACPQCGMPLIEEMEE